MKNHLSKLLFFFFLALLSLNGCSQDNSGSEMQPGDYHLMISSGGTMREYLLHVPLGYDSTALPLMFLLHGFGGTADGFMKGSHMADKADLENFFVVAPQGMVSAVGGRGWNSGMTPSLGINTDDVALIRDIFEQLKGQLLVDTRKVYAAGFSNGAFMCHRLAAELPDLLAGVAAVAGTVGLSQDGGATYSMIPDPKGPIPMIMIHGEQDPNVKYYGGQGGGEGQLYDKSVAESLALWTAADSCTAAPIIETSTNGNIITEDHTACSAGSEVELVSIVNGLHEWPTPEGHTGFSANDAIWEFFTRHTK